jgi:hypothetical protein
MKVIILVALLSVLMFFILEYFPGKAPGPASNTLTNTPPPTPVRDPARGWAAVSNALGQVRLDLARSTNSNELVVLRGIELRLSNALHQPKP